jgi:DNA-directed RNA polymerase specialized sigma24 family protein
VGTSVPSADAATFEAHRPALLALAYRMLGEVARAEDVVQEAWLRWQGRHAVVDPPKAFLLQLGGPTSRRRAGSAWRKTWRILPSATETRIARTTRPFLTRWAYAGFTFDFLAASLSHALRGDGAAAVSPLVALGLLATSYVLWHRPHLETAS